MVDMMAVVGKAEQREADKMEPGSRRAEDMDRVEGKLVVDRTKVDRFEGDKPREGRVGADREKRVSQGKLA